MAKNVYQIYSHIVGLSTSTSSQDISSLMGKYGKYGKTYANIVGCSVSTSFRIVGMTRVATVGTGGFHHPSMGQEFTIGPCRASGKFTSTRSEKEDHHTFSS
jgi:hypothetical protein